MELSLEKTERTYVRLFIGSLLALVIFVALCWSGFHFYRHWEEGHLVRRAAAFMSGGDLKTASLNARRALQLNEQNADATRVIAQVAEKSGDRTALDWRKKVLELNPGSADDALALVRCALWFKDFGTAEKTLESIESSASEKPEFYAASGRLAEMKKNLAGAEKFWEKAAELAPNEPAYRFQLALVRLSSGDAVKREIALNVLEQLQGDAAQRTAATRALIIDNISHHGDPQKSRDLARTLQNYPESLFSDRIMYLEILRQMQDSEYEKYLARLKGEVPAKPSDLAALISWMIRNQMSAEAFEFIKSVPADALTKWPVPLAVAEAHAQSQDWPGLDRLTKDSDWAGYDFLRRAYLARALRGERNKLAAKQELAAAQKEASANPQTLSMLTQTLADWGWQNEAVELLWVLAKNPETRMQALQTLYEHYTKTADTSGLYRTLTRFAEINPDDVALQNNLAQISLLLHADLDHARKTAAELIEKEPNNPAYLSTYAFGLLTKGDTKGALKVMDGLTPEQLRDPSVATYYGIVLAEAGQKEKAREFLQRSAQAKLLPEEKALVAKAESSLN